VEPVAGRNRDGNSLDRKPVGVRRRRHLLSLSSPPQVLRAGMPSPRQY
jgi:hypothetical protein